MARWFIEQRMASSPLFLEIGFPGPHPPYDPPARRLRAYDDVDISVPQGPPTGSPISPHPGPPTGAS